MHSSELDYSPEKLPSRKALDEYFSRVLIFSNSHPEISRDTEGFGTPVPEGFPVGWELLHGGKPVGHLTLEDSGGNKIIYCLRPEGFDGFVYEPHLAYDRYFPITHINGQLFFGVIPKSDKDYCVPQTPIPSARMLRSYEDPLLDIFQSRLPIIDHRDLNPNSAWVVSQGSRGLQYSGQTILPHDIEIDANGAHFKKPRSPKEAEILFLPPEKLLPSRSAPTVAAVILSLENRYQISDIQNPLPFNPVSYQEEEFTNKVFETATVTTRTNGWSATELNGQSISIPNYELHSVNKRMGVTVGTGITSERKDIFRVNEIGGGGAAIVPYFIENNILYIGVIKETRPNISSKEPYFSVVRGFINPGDTPKKAISHEIGQEMQYDGNPGDIANHLQHLGLASQDPDMFGLGGVHYYALPIDKNILDEKDGKFTIKKSHRSNNEEYNRSSEKMWEKIMGAEFVPAEIALLSPCLFATIATGRLLTSNLIKRS